MEIIIERIENDIAVVELPNKELINVPKKIFGDVKENDIVEININTKKTIQKKEEMKKLIDEVFKD